MIHGKATNKVLIDVFQDYKKHRSLKLKTINTYDHVLRHGLADWLYLPINEITGQMVYQRHTELSANAPHLADLTFRVLRAIFKWASAFYEDEAGEAVITRNPVDKITGLRVWNGASRRQGRILPKDMPVWFAAVQNLKDPLVRDWILLMLFGGFRRMEATTLRWENVDFTEGTIEIVKERAKNGKAHVVPMSDFIWDMLARRYELSSKTGWVFPSRSMPGNHMSEYERGHYAVIKDTGIEFIIHDLRRTFTSIATDLKLNEYQVKKLVNHSGADDVTYGYYIADVEALRESVQCIADEILNQATNSKYDKAS